MCKNTHDITGAKAAVPGGTAAVPGASAAETPGDTAAVPGYTAAVPGDTAGDTAAVPPGAGGAVPPGKEPIPSAQAADLFIFKTAVCLTTSTKASRMFDMVDRAQPATPTPTRSGHAEANDRAHVDGHDKPTLARNSGVIRFLIPDCFPTLT